jgi:flagellar capping protein FliD
VRFGEGADALTQSNTGAISRKVEGLDDITEGFEKTVERLEEQVKKQEERLVKEFARLEQLLAESQATIQRLQSQQSGLISIASASRGRKGASRSK